jgi:3-phenylpropionate/trans-cinnamate dioxygenase ferredoxin reductase subunit
MSTFESVVIAGAGLAGAKAAETLRTGGFEGLITLIGEEAERPYERPPLSKGYLRGEQQFDAAAVHPADFYEQQGIDLLSSTSVTAILPHSNEVETGDGRRIPYDRLLIATGARPRHLSVTGADLDGVMYLRDVGDSDRIRQAAREGRPVVVIGAGWIGSEVAASARQLGADVTVVDMVSVPLERVLGVEIGTVFGNLHADNGVRFHLGVGIESIQGASSVEAVKLTDGTVIPAGAVVAGVGVAPRTELAETAGIEVDNGVLTDEYLETSIPAIYAAGDVANAYHPFYRQRLRLEHWSSALNQGPAAAWNILGEKKVYDKIPYFFSDQYDFGMEYRGWSTPQDEVVIRHGKSDKEFLAFWLRDSLVIAAMNANIWDQGDQLEALIHSRTPVEKAKLSDPDHEITSLLTPK